MSTQETWWPSRYGAGDQLGALNEITPAKTASAARLVRRGLTYDLGRTLHADVPRFEGRYWQQSLVSAAHLINRRKPDQLDHRVGHGHVADRHAPGWTESSADRGSLLQRLARRGDRRGLGHQQVRYRDGAADRHAWRARRHRPLSGCRAVSGR